MADKKTTATSPATNKQMWLKQPWVGTIAQWAAFLGMVVLFLVSRYAEHTSQDFDFRVDKRIDDKLVPANTKLDGLAQRMSTIEGEITVLLAQRSVAASGRYAAQGKIELAVKAARQAQDTLSSAAANKLPAPPEYFIDTVEVIADVARVSTSHQLSNELHDVRLSLAKYRSSLVPIGQVVYTQKMVVGPDGAFKPGPGSSLVGGYFDVRQVKGDFIQLHFPPKPRPTENFRVEGAIISGGAQTLDNISWANVTFIGTHIKYNGGKLDLQNVTFVGCTFWAPDDNAGIEFADAVALLRSTLTIG